MPKFHHFRRVRIRQFTLRMNDCHGNLEEADIRKSSYVEKNKQLWRVQHRKPTEYFDKCFDYALPEVRERMLAYIEEMLNNYSPDGLELDFTREMKLTKIGFEYESFDIITDFLTDVYNLVQKEAIKSGHKIKIGVLIGANINATFNRGFDVKEWCDKGLVDFVTILPRWQTINPNMDIGLWKRLITNGVKLGTGLQLLLDCEANHEAKMALIDHDFGQAAANLSLGADFIYLYNHFDITERGLDGVKTKNSVREPENLRLILNNIGTLETAVNFKRRHILTYDDYHAEWENLNPRLPLVLNESYQQLRIAVGEVRKGEKAELVLGFTENITAEELAVYINSRKLSFKCGGGRFDNKEYSYTFNIPEETIKTYAITEVACSSRAVLNFAEIVVEKYI